MKYIGILVAVGVAILLCYKFFTDVKSWDLHRKLSHVPPAFGVSKIVYQTEKSAGFGPGGNETGIIVYELPITSAERILNEGIEYLNTTRPLNGSSDWHGKYYTWGSTPMMLEGDGGGPNKTNDYEISHYLDRYGFGIPLDPKIEEEINTALANPGCYFSYGRIGFILVMPKSRRVVYAYNG